MVGNLVILRYRGNSNIYSPNCVNYHSHIEYTSTLCEFGTNKARWILNKHKARKTRVYTTGIEMFVVLAKVVILRIISALFHRSPLLF